jgi:hypothetical protein
MGFIHLLFYRSFLFILFSLCLLSACSNRSNTNPVQIFPTVIKTETIPQIPTLTRQDTLTPVVTGDSDHNNNGGITLGEDSKILPIPPYDVKVALNQECVEVIWQGTGVDNIVLYKIYRRSKGAQGWDFINTVPVQNDNKGVYRFCDLKASNQASIYEYAVAAQDHYGNESQKSDPKAMN